MGITDIWEELARQANQDRRKQQRVSLAVPIQVSGLDCHGRFFSERTTTENISESGCRFALRTTQLERGAVVVVHVVSRNQADTKPQKAAFFEVEWCHSQPDDTWYVGALKLQRESIWQMAFPSEIGQVHLVA
jgi:hypothetical protein